MAGIVLQGSETRGDCNNDHRCMAFMAFRIGVIMEHVHLSHACLISAMFVHNPGAEEKNEATLRSTESHQGIYSVRKQLSFCGYTTSPQQMCAADRGRSRPVGRQRQTHVPSTPSHPVQPTPSNVTPSIPFTTRQLQLKVTCGRCTYPPYPMDDDEDLFDDADLQELEQDALAATQQPSAPRARTVSRTSDYGFDDDEDVINLDAEASEPAAPAHQSCGEPSPVKAVPHPQQQRPTWQPSQREQHPTSQRWQQDQIPSRPSHNGTSTGLSGNAPLRSAKSQGNVQHTARLEPPSGATDTLTLEARVTELEAERARLKKTAEDAQSALYAKTGEISIVRSNHDKAAKDFERRMAVLQKTHAEEIAKQQAELAAAKSDVQKSKTDQTFLEHDLKIAQEARRRTLKEGPGNKQLSTVTTPKKTRNAVYRDGFDDDEIAMVSPSKSRDRRGKDKNTTPKGHGKRKRADTQQHSPTKPLPLSAPTSFEDALQSLPMDIEEDVAPVVEDPSITWTLPMRSKEIDHAKEKFDFMRLVLGHQTHANDERTIERLTTYEYAPKRSASIASRLYDFFALPHERTDAASFRLQFCELLLELWFHFFEARKFAPLKDLADLLQDILTDRPSELCRGLLPRVVTLCFNATDYVALKLIRAHKDPSKNEAPSDELLVQLNPLEYLDLAHTVALHCLPLATEDEGHLTKFWAAVPLETVLMLLHKVQPLEQILTLLSLLDSSILRDGFGPRVEPDVLKGQEDRDRQMKNEDSLLKRLTVLLFEKPIAHKAGPQYTAMDILSLRAAIIAFLNHLVVSQRGGQALAEHGLLIGRLARFIHECVLAMYAYDPPTHDMTVSLLNQAVKLLAYLTTEYSQVFDLRAKLSAVPSGAHMHLVALSKIAFAEGHSVIERGIEPEVAEAAHRMLDEHLSPDEGEAVMEVFSSAKSWNEG